MTSVEPSPPPKVDRRPHQAAHRPHATRANPWSLLPALTWVLLAISATAPLKEVDSYWHVLVGRDILTHHRFTGDPAWVFGPHHSWTTTQWASEVLMSAAHSALGWGGLTVLALVCGLTTLHVTSHTLRHPAADPRLPAAAAATVNTPPAVWAVFAIVGFAVAADLQERPASISYVFLAILARWSWTALTTRTWPAWWKVAAFTCLWAQFHGYWVLVVASVVVVALGHAIDERSLARWRPTAALAAVTTVAGTLTPAGWHGLVAPVVFKKTAGPFIEEWAPTTLTEPSAIALAVLLTLTVYAWARQRDAAGPVPAATLLWVSAWAVFGMLAFRNVTPAILMLAPATAAALRNVPAHHRKTAAGTWVTAAALTIVITAGTATTVYRLTTGDPLASDRPTDAYSLLNQAPGTPRVLNYYDLGGQVLALTDARAAIDGRADMYGPDVLSTYQALMHLHPGWQDTLAAYQPTHVLIPSDIALNEGLANLGWTTETTDHGYTLWSEPTR